jgi:tyrosyl-tRNA synthetase
MDNYLTLLTDVPREQIDRLLDDRHTHPRDAKIELGKRIVAQFHGAAAADSAAEEFARIFAAKELPTDMPEIALPPEALSDGKIAIMALIVRAGFAKSNGEARRLVEQGAVSLDGERIGDFNALISPTAGQVLRVGKRRFGRIAMP